MEFLELGVLFSMFTEIQHKMYNCLLERETELGFVIIDRNELLELLLDFEANISEKNEVINEYLDEVDKFI